MVTAKHAALKNEYTTLKPVLSKRRGRVPPRRV